jgi:hypothetical protein
MSKLVIGPCRFSYAHVFTKFKFDDDQGEGQYSVTLLVPKTDKKAVAAINAAIAEATKDGIAKTWGNKKPANLKTPLRDGDTDNAKDAPELVGMYYMRARSKNQPGVVDKARQPITNESEFYSGCYGYASVSLLSYDQAGNKGIGAYLNNVMKTKDGESLGGGSTPDEDFADLEVEEDDLI